MINIVVITHGELAFGFKSAVELLSGESQKIYYLSIMPSDDENILSTKLNELNLDSNTIIFTDIQGGTPHKVATIYQMNNEKVEVITGVNLPLLINTILLRETVKSNSDLLKLVMVERDSYISNNMTD